MEKIKKLIRRKNSIKILLLIATIVLVVVFAVLFSLYVVETLMWQKVIILIFLLFSLLFSFFSLFSSLREEKGEGGVWEKLEKRGEKREFEKTIEEEIEKKLLFEYIRSQYLISVILTEKWLIFLSASGSFITKVEEIENVFSSYNRKHCFFNIVLRDGDSYKISCSSVCEEIVEKIKRKIPKLIR